MATSQRLSLVLITTLVLDIALCSASMALGQTGRELNEPGMKLGAVAGPSEAAAEANSSTLPDAPGTPWQNDQRSSASSDTRDSATAVKVSDQAKQTKRILYIIPNFRAVSADQQLPPQTVKDKFTTAALDSVDYSSFIFVAIQAGLAEARKSTPEFQQGWPGYGRYYWHTYADYVNENLWVEFILPAALHQDSRYYTLGHGGFAKRLAYSISRVAITRTDSGHETFNASEIVGAGAAAGVSSLYYPSQERTFTKTYQLWFTSIALDAGSSLFKEFWPDINNKVFHQKN
jgi:hypothetical protein